MSSESESKNTSTTQPKAAAPKSRRTTAAKPKTSSSAPAKPEPSEFTRRRVWPD